MSWIMSPRHRHNPYPSRDQKDALAAVAGITVKQVSVWFTNARKRVLGRLAPTAAPDNGDASGQQQLLDTVHKIDDSDVPSCVKRWQRRTRARHDVDGSGRGGVRPAPSSLDVDQPGMIDEGAATAGSVDALPGPALQALASRRVQLQTMIEALEEQERALHAALS